MLRLTEDQLIGFPFNNTKKVQEKNLKYTHLGWLKLYLSLLMFEKLTKVNKWTSLTETNWEKSQSFQNFPSPCPRLVQTSLCFRLITERGCIEGGILDYDTYNGIKGHVLVWLNIFCWYGWPGWTKKEKILSAHTFFLAWLTLVHPLFQIFPWDRTQLRGFGNKICAYM